MVRFTTGHAQGEGYIVSPDGTMRELNPAEWTELHDGDQVRSDGKTVVRDNRGKTVTVDRGDVHTPSSGADNEDDDYVEDRRGEPQPDKSPDESSASTDDDSEPESESESGSGSGD